MATYTKPSILLAAVFPAITVEPKELTDDCISTFEIENIQPCSPAGRPIFIMPMHLSGVIFILFKHSFIEPLSCIKQRMIRAHDTACDITVAMATPATPNLNVVTKNMLRITFIIPAMVR